MGMESGSYQKKILLFLLVFVLPCIVLVLLSLRMISQERELAQKRAGDERGRTASEISRLLLTRLENIKLQALSVESSSIVSMNPEIVFLGRVKDAKLELPWEIHPAGNPELQSLKHPDFSNRVRRAENLEFVSQNYSRSTSLYRRILEASQTDSQRAFSRLLLARVLMKSGQREEALSQFMILLALPSTVIDEFGIPFCLYAARQLAENAVAIDEILRRLRVSLEHPRWISPSAAYMIQEVCLKIAEAASEKALKNRAETALNEVRRHLETLSKILALQEDFSGMALNLGERDQDTLWAAYDAERWLMNLLPASGERPETLIVVNTADALRSLRGDGTNLQILPENIHIVSDVTSDGEYLGSNFSGLKITWAEDTDQNPAPLWTSQSFFYVLTIFVVIGVTLFGAYLLWRDIRRELRLGEMRSQFVSSVSHELKTPLTSIRMFAETLRLGRSRDKAVQNEYLDTIVNESQRLTRFLTNVLDFSKITKGKRTYRMEYGSLPEILQEAARAMDYQLSQQGFKLHLDLENNLPEIRVDRDALEQAVLNLLSNAMKYSGDSRDINLGLRREGNYAVVRVMDKGIGIDPRDHERIFEKYYRVETPENVGSTGTGLGLALVSHIVQAHGGRIDVESAPGKGSVFSIFLPLEAQE